MQYKWLFLVFLFILGCTTRDVTRIQIGDTVVTAELAISPEQHEQGLMYRESLAPDAGMLFVFSKPQFLSFWMKNTKIPLDMIFFDENKTVVKIVTALPCTQDLCQNYGGITAKYVLEVNSGFAKENAVSVGMRVAFDE
ncbi:MAG: DUF192 domain-containing protein [Candidatus Woesearchaeota archaeon]|nr:DUF192 domain-containing protein [Candidatus Woesearchaeota archaeon]